MNLTKLTLTSFLMTSLIACGGGSPNSDSEQPSLGSDDSTTLDDSNGDDGVVDGGSSESTIVPKLGSGSGVSFVVGEITGEVELIDKTFTTLSLNAVDVSNINSVISSEDYTAKWTSTCTDASFNVLQQTLNQSSNIETRYDANSCAPNDTVTVSLYENADLNTPVDTATVTISIGVLASSGVTPNLGLGNGSAFNTGKIGLSADYVLAGDSVVITVNGVNSDTNNTLLDTSYLYKFSSLCATNTINFSSPVVSSDNGTVVNTYFNHQCDVADTITVELYSADADVNVDSPVATASVDLRTGLPKLGYESGANFVEDTIEGNLNLVDDSSTLLSATVVDPLNVNTLVSSADYSVVWSSVCGTAKFSIEEQNISSAITTRYDGDADLCPTDTVTLTLLNSQKDVLYSVDADITINESLIPADPVLGTGTEAGFVLGVVTFSETEIDSRQTIEASVNIVDQSGGSNTLITDTEYAIEFSSACVTGGDASFDNASVRTTGGIARVYYTASGCSGGDTINAALYPVENNVVDTTTSLALAKGDITIALPESNSIEYQGMTSRKIAMQNLSFASLPETTTVSFMVKDEFDQPIGGKQVAFSLSNKSVGASLSGGTDGSILNEGEYIATTNAEGIVTITVKSGQTHGQLTVKAIAEKNDGSPLRSQSFGISITTGIPVQPSFSLVLDNFNPRGWDFFGTTVSATVFLSDRFHNPVPDGTIVNFLADGGSIEPTCETSNGSCAVNWRSQNPRPGFSKDNSPLARQQTKTATEHPTNDPSTQLYLGADSIVDVNPLWNGGRSGLVTIMAYVEGEVDYADANANGRFDADEDYSAMAEAYLDANEDGMYTAPDENNPFEQLIEYVEDGAQNPGPSTYQGSTCTEAARGAGHCASLVHLRREAQLVMSSDNVGFQLASITGGLSGDLSSATCINVFNEDSVTFNFLVHDYNGNTPINGTTLTLEAEGFDVDAQPDAIGNAAFTAPVSVPVTIRAGDEYEDKKVNVRLSAAHPDDGVAGSISTVSVTDWPFIKIETTDYTMDISSTSQVVTFKFADACGNPPADSDIFIFEATNFDQATYSGGVATPKPKGFQVSGSELQPGGIYQLELSNPVLGATGDGTLAIKTINFAAGGLESTREFSVTLE